MTSAGTGPGDLPSISPQVGMNVRRHRMCKKLTVAELAERAGYTESEIEDYEQGRAEVGGVDALNIASAMGLSVARLFEGVGFDPKPNMLS